MNLTTRLRSDDKTVLKELFDAHYKAVCAAIHRIVGERGVTEDLAQQVFIRFWEKRNQIQINTSPGAYLHRMAVNESLAWLRAKKNQQPEEITFATPLPAQMDGEVILLHSELSDQIHKAIDALPPRCRTVFQLSRFEELSYQEIADEMGISIKTVEHQMGKALRVLREQLKAFLS
ncbi:MAG: RNA polymerase sigma-70 factor [Saprospiraceae bacterium]|nr:RNA polymerase sigma-70 factor [Saprospiraceae bacterium]MCF8250999.1 RNA polymerase sigma-70 factor [Saprospiraceae bacterium]MCF8282818.1 RNA polymerase sigma-70 factor [Bacteroidales bacterium]MCF8311596.1 RNA polymerase sigma-70 factor [Saprospiraceae bacterium]MCF8440937.1 RNA polymerase sigma-70 factor [Saprospiraceae bacterium]